MIEKLCTLLGDAHFSKGKGAKNVQLTLTFSNFQPVNETLNLKTPLIHAEDMIREAMKMYKQAYRKGAAIRHMRVAITLAEREAGQLSIASFLQMPSHPSLKRKR